MMDLYVTFKEDASFTKVTGVLASHKTPCIFKLSGGTGWPLHTLLIEAFFKFLKGKRKAQQSNNLDVFQANTD